MNAFGTNSSISIPVYEGSMISVRSPIPNGSAAKRSDTNKIEFINWKQGAIQPQYECNYCNTYLKYPVQFQECGHRVCSSCLSELLKYSSTCPTCENSIDRDNVVIDKEFQKEIQNLEVLCTYESNGCQWEGVYKGLQLHLEECECILVSCKRGCGAKYLRKDEQTHLEDQCNKQELECEFCKKVLAKEAEIDHLTVCTEFLIPCPNSCGAKEIKRSLMQNHLENECSKQQLPCPFSDSGCAFSSLRTEMGRHIKESPGIHLNMLCKTVSLQKSQMQLMSEIIDKQKEKMDEITTKINSLEMIFGSQFIWKIDNYTEKLNDCKTGKKPIIFSPPFFTSRYGYKLALSTSLYGDGKVKGKFMSLYVCVCRGEYDGLLSWPFGHRITLTLLDQCKNLEERRPITYVIKPNTCKENTPFLGRPYGERNAPFGAQKFVDLEVISTLDYIVDDTIFIKVEVDSGMMTPL